MSDDSGPTSQRTFSHVLRVPAQLGEQKPRVYVSWRGLALESPPSLKPIAAGRTVRIAACFTERGVLMLRIVHPDDGTHADYCVCWLMKHADGPVLLLELPPDWPIEEDRKLQVVVKLESRGELRTLDALECLRCYGLVRADMENRKSWGRVDAEEIFGPIPDGLSAEFQTRGLDREARKIQCYSCEKEIADTDEVCPHCKATRTAPPCPQCGKPVSNEKDERIWHNDENGWYPWHLRWNYRCIGCGCEFSARIIVNTGHDPFFVSEKDLPDWLPPSVKGRDDDRSSYPAGKSLVEIAAGESLHLVCDDWRYAPTIAVRVRRAVAANQEDAEFGLKNETRIVLSIEEWRTIIEQLSGPLFPLMQRKHWSRDTT